MSPQHRQLQLLFQLYILSQYLELDREIELFLELFIINLAILLDNTDAVMLGERSLLNIRVDTAGKIVDSLPDVPVKIKELSLVVIAVVVSLTRVVCLSLLVEMVEVIVVVGDV